MARAAIRNDEGIGLILAIAAHAALLAALVFHPPGRTVVPPPERMTVTLAPDVSLASTSPEPAARAAPDVAPVIGDPPAPQPAPQPVSAPEAVKKVEPEPLPPRPVATPRPVPRTLPVPVPRPSPRAAPTAVAKAVPAKRPAPASAPVPRATASASAPASTPASARAVAGGSRIGNDFLKGVKGAQATGASRNAPAAVIGPAVQSALAGAISRQLKPKWAAPQGVDADRLVTILAWSLNKDGSLAAAPHVVRQDGITEANRPQAARHAEQAIRAVQLAAPFDLPPEYYDAWKRVAQFRFDKRLSQ
jgi:outer membrane biosynthesis protein TonB